MDDSTHGFMKKLVPLALLAAFVAFAATSVANAAPVAKQRVIVELNVPAGATPAEISSATDAVLSLLPAGSFDVNNRYSTLPYVAISAGPTALSVLRASDLVVGISSDGVVSAASSKKKCKTGKKSKKHKKSKKSCARSSVTN